MEFKSAFPVGMIALFMFFGVACGNGGKDTKEGVDSLRDMTAGPIEVKVLVAKNGIFENRRFTNGSLRARRKAEVVFSSGGRLLSLKASNGKKVEAGEILAILDTTATSLGIQRARLQIEKARLYFQDNLLALGYDVKNIKAIPAEVLENSKIISGLREAELNLEESVNEYRKCFVRAPIRGIVTGLAEDIQGNIMAGRKLCSLVDNSDLLVAFQVFQSDINALHPGMPVTVIPLAGEESVAVARINYIAPTIGENGLCEVTAELGKTPTHEFFDGMQVKVAINLSRTQALVVPKQVVVFRQDKPVVFRVKDGKAEWTDVEVGGENDQYYLIRKGLQPGDVVVAENNTWLGHNARVLVKDTLRYLP